MLILLIIVAILLLTIKNNNIESFQFLRQSDNTFKPVVHIDNIKKRNIIVSMQVTDYDRCAELCRTTPHCNALNYALNDCTLYRDINYIKIDHPRRWW
jgi:hypothetical protein